MSLEIEQRYFTFDYADVVARLGRLGIRKGTYLFRVATFYPKDGFDYMRVRDEGYRITMTIKKDGEPYDTEWETTVGSYDITVQMCKLMGMRTKYIVEKIREIWDVDRDSEVIFDWYPGLPPIIEIESTTETAMKALQMKLGLHDEKQTGASAIYERLYGITSQRPHGDLTFDRAEDIFVPHIKYGREGFDRELAEQREKIRSGLSA